MKVSPSVGGSCMGHWYGLIPCDPWFQFELSQPENTFPAARNSSEACSAFARAAGPVSQTPWRPLALQLCITALVGT